MMSRDGGPSVRFVGTFIRRQIAFVCCRVAMSFIGTASRRGSGSRLAARCAGAALRERRPGGVSEIWIVPPRVGHEWTERLVFRLGFVL